MYNWYKTNIVQRVFVWTNVPLYLSIFCWFMKRCILKKVMGGDKIKLCDSMLHDGDFKQQSHLWHITLCSRTRCVTYKLKCHHVVWHITLCGTQLFVTVILCYIMLGTLTRRRHLKPYSVISITLRYVFALSHNALTLLRSVVAYICLKNRIGYFGAVIASFSYSSSW